MARQALLLICATLLLAGGIYAGWLMTMTFPNAGNWLGGNRPVDTVVMANLTQELSLTAAQAEKIKPIVTSACASLRMLSEEGRAQRLEVMDDVNLTIAQDLTSDQRSRLDALATEMQQRPPIKRDMRIVALF
jgi:hypothetical protein